MNVLKAVSYCNISSRWRERPPPRTWTHSLEIRAPPPSESRRETGDTHIYLYYSNSSIWGVVNIWHDSKDTIFTFPHLPTRQAKHLFNNIPLLSQCTTMLVLSGKCSFRAHGFNVSLECILIITCIAYFSFLLLH